MVEKMQKEVKLKVVWYKRSFTKEFFKQWWLALFYIFATSGCLYMANRSTDNAKVSIAWLFATIIVMQMTTDLYDFTNKQHKAYFTAVLRFLSGALTLLIAYTLSV